MKETLHFIRTGCDLFTPGWMLHLNVGIGEAWALQAMDNDKPKPDIIFSVASEENLGVDPPIGSKVGILKRDEKFHLNAGLGLDWAGHVKAIDWWLFAKICSIATEENFGTLLPMGSIKVSKSKYTSKTYCIAWMSLWVLASFLFSKVAYNTEI